MSIFRSDTHRANVWLDVRIEVASLPTISSPATIEALLTTLAQLENDHMASRRQIAALQQTQIAAAGAANDDTAVPEPGPTQIDSVDADDYHTLDATTMQQLQQIDDTARATMVPMPMVDANGMDFNFRAELALYTDDTTADHSLHSD